MYTNILIPTDGSELAGKAVEHGIDLAKRIGAKVTVLTVLPPFHTLPSRPGEFHPEPLTDPDVTLSCHPARATARRLPPSVENLSSSRYRLALSQRR